MQLSPELIEEISDEVRKGLHPEVAAIKCGVPRRPDWPTWWALGRELYETQARDLNDHERLCAELVRRVDIAEAECEERLLTTHLTSAAIGRNNAAQAAMWLLERRFPTRWGKRPPQSPTKPHESLEDMLDRIRQADGEA